MTEQDQRQRPSQDDVPVEQIRLESDSSQGSLASLSATMPNETVIRKKVDDESDRAIELDFDQGKLKYKGSQIDEVDSQWNSSGSLIVTIDNGDSWAGDRIYGPLTLSNTTVSGKRTITAPFPSTGDTMWVLSNGDEPAVKLTIVVRRI